MTDPSVSGEPVDPSIPRNGADSSPRRCTGHNARTKRRCKRYALLGATVCDSHGAAAPQVKAAALKRHARAQAASEWAKTYGEPAPDVDPAAAVIEQISWTTGHVRWLRDRVASLEPDALTWGVANEIDRASGEFPGLDTTRAAQANVWLTLYGQERDRLVNMCRIAHAMGIEERRVAMAEHLGGAIAEVISAVLDDLSLSEVQWSAARAAVPTRLRAVAVELGGVA